MDEPQTAPTGPGLPPPRPGLVVSAAGGLGRLVDAYDRVFVLGLVLLFAGLWRWFHLGVALTAAGALLLAMVVASAARQPAPAGAPADRPDGG